MAHPPSLIALTVLLAVLAVAFWAIERVAPAIRDQRRRQRQTRLDLVYWFFTPLVTRWVTKAAIVLVFVIVALAEGVPLKEFAAHAAGRETWVRSWPLWVQIPAMLVLADLLAYWAHRLFHHRRLWPLHAIHHSSTELDWLSSVRVHPLNDAAARVAQVLPLYLLGFDGAVLAAFVPFLTLYAILLHANVRWTFGPLRYVIASPVFHRWHHTSEDEGLDTNFAGLFPFIDLAFGTFHMPADRLPARFGLVRDAVPDGLIGQLVHPFRRVGSGSGSSRGH